MGNSIVSSRRADKLVYDNTLCAVDHKGSRLCHQREISHKDLVFVYLIIFLIIQPYSDFQRRRVSRITLFALVDRVLHVVFTKRKIDKFQTQMSAVVSDRGNIVEDLFESFIEEPLIGILLNFNE